MATFSKYGKTKGTELQIQENEWTLNRINYKS
jgi:hypothetical protein